VYPFGRRELTRLAYFFDFHYPDERRPYDYTREVKQVIDDWYTVRNPSLKPEEYPKLDATIVDQDDILITDTRPCAPVRSSLLSGVACAPEHDTSSSLIGPPVEVE
jgi:hypothetical protein